MRLEKLIAVCIATIVATCAMAQVEPGSFLNKPVDSTAALVNHARNDQRVMDRYMRHYAMTEGEVVEFLGNLDVARTDIDALYVVYGAPTDGPLRSRLVRVKKGTKVFVDDTGDVVLILHCGNPVNRGPKTPLDVSRPIANPSGIAMEEMRNVPLQAPVSTIEASIALPTEPFVPDVPVLPPDQQSNIPLVPSASPASFLGLLPILGVISSQGGNGNPPVPEPATMAALTIGLAGVVARSRKKK